ncbi:MAG: preprotein translocase subunit SecE [Candidatus Omnitrophica bacterium]|nr:preprotein translocase subunit SecE [Candidatus Omnitrophota bacterium]
MFGRFTGFIEETRQELKKVTWPSRNEIVQATGVVIVTTFLMGCLIGFADIFLAWAVRLILG